MRPAPGPRVGPRSGALGAAAGAAPACFRSATAVRSGCIPSAC